MKSCWEWQSSLPRYCPPENCHFRSKNEIFYSLHTTVVCFRFQIKWSFHFETNFWCPQFLPKNERKQVNLSYHGSKVEFICSFFGRIHGVTICFQVLLTFNCSHLWDKLQKDAVFLLLLLGALRSQLSSKNCSTGVNF